MRTGQEVVCVETHSTGLVVRGRHYTLTGIFETCACGPLVTIGLQAVSTTGERILIGERTTCFDCLVEHRNPTNEHRFHPSLFRPIIENLTADLARKEAERIVIERPEHINEPQPAQP